MPWISFPIVVNAIPCAIPGSNMCGNPRLHVDGLQRCDRFRAQHVFSTWSVYGGAASYSLITNNKFLAMHFRLLDEIHHILYRVYSLFMNDNTPNMLLSIGLAIGMSIEKAVNSKLKLADNVSIILVEFFKMDKPPYHEFIVFTVEEDGPRRSSATIVVDRFVGEVSTELLQDGPSLRDAGIPELMYEPGSGPGPNQLSDPIDYAPKEYASMDPADSQSEHPSITKADIAKGTVALISSSSIKIAAPFIPKRPSKDFITFVPLPNQYLQTERKGGELCKKFQIPRRTLSLAELLVLIYTVHDHNPSYHLLRHQCYWFADTIYNAVKMRCGVSSEDLPLPDKPGKFGDVRVQHTNSETPQVVLEKHRTAWYLQKSSNTNVSFELALHVASCLKDIVLTDNSGTS